MSWEACSAGPFRVTHAPRESLAGHVECIWAERTSRADPLLPDAAVELVWSGRGLFVRGADTHAHAIGAFPERTFVAVRFRPGAAAGVLGLHGAELADARVGVSALWGRSETERLESELALRGGYADQPHLTRECVRLAGVTPATLLTRR